MAHALSSLIDRLATPVSRRTGITSALLAIAAGLAGSAETDAKKKKTKKKKLGQSCRQVSDCANAQAWQCAPYANNKFSSSPTATFCLLHDGDPCDQNSACPYGNCVNGQCASASVVASANGQYSTIADAVAGTFAGGEICFMPGTYNDVSVSIDKTLTITMCGNSGQVTLNSPNNGRVFTLQLANAEDVVTIRGVTMDSFTMSGLAVADADRLDDGGIIDLSLPGTGATAAGSLVLEFVTLTKGKARTSGGGIRAHTTGSVTLTDVMVKECVSPKGGGIAMKQGALTLKGQSWVKSCQASLRGAGVLLVEGPATLSLEDTAKIGTDYPSGDGIACVQAGGNWSVSGLGGGIYAETGTSVTMADNATVFCNVAGNGGGIFVDTDASLSGTATCQSGKVASNFDNGGDSNIETPLTASC